MTTAQQQEEHLQGVVERVTFHSEETGFSVLRVKVKGHRELVALIGTIPSVSPGEWVDAEGTWLVDPKHGRQFKAQHLRSTAPDTLEGIEKYLGSGLIRGIGPVYAGKLVERFGKNIFDVIDTRSALLEQVEGIGAMRRKQIKEAWNEQKSVREIMTFLFSHSVSTSRAFRIYKTYGEKAIEVVRRDPYCLARDIRGIGFKIADQIAASLGIEKESDLRARAGVEFVLQELTGEGHCAYPREGLIEAARGILEIDEEVVARAVDHGVAIRRLVQEAGPRGEELIFLSPLHAAELELAALLTRMVRGPHPCPEIHLEKALAWAQEKVGLELAPAQREAVGAAVRSKVLVITGGPGVGKTTLINAILKIVRAKKVRTMLCAPTGRAAKRLSESTGLQAKTIHRLLVFDPKTGEFKHNRNHLLPGDFFVVDEASMIDLKLAYQLVSAIPPRAALILVGDMDQLPSVGPGSVLRDIIDSGTVQVCRLNEVFRQAAESAIVTNAHRVNQGMMPEYPEQKTDHADFYFVEADEPEEGVAKIVRLVKHSIPRSFGFHPVRDIQVLTPMQRGELGARNLNARLQQALNPSGESVERFGYLYRKGDKVMQIENDYDKDVFNGDIGVIHALDTGERDLTVNYEGSKVGYDFNELDELVLSYAITIHKSQGSEYPCVVMPIHTQHFIMLQRNLLYTGLTRGRKLVVLVGTKKALAMAVKRQDTRHRITTLKEKIRAASSG